MLLYTYTNGLENNFKLKFSYFMKLIFKQLPYKKSNLQDSLMLENLKSDATIY